MICEQCEEETGRVTGCLKCQRWVCDDCLKDGLCLDCKRKEEE